MASVVAISISFATLGFRSVTVVVVTISGNGGVNFSNFHQSIWKNYGYCNGVSSDSHRATPASSSSFTSKLLLMLTILPLILAVFAFVLQWRGGLNDPATRWSPDPLFAGMDPSGPARSSSSSDCVDLLGQSRSATFPYYRDWKFNFGSDLRPKLCITASTSAGLEQILPWLFYHKVIGVTNFFLFVEGKAATPTVSKVLESIPGVKVIYKTKELEEQHARRYWKSNPNFFDYEEH